MQLPCKGNGVFDKLKFHLNIMLIIPVHHLGHGNWEKVNQREVIENLKH